jgi:hypothetical protein
VTPDADHGTIVVEQDVLHGELLPGFDTGVGGGVHQDLVEHAAPRGVGGGGAVDRAGRAGDGERTEVERVGVDRRTACRQNVVEQPPAPQRGDARRVDDVGGDRIARERRPVDQQDPMALPGEQHGGAGAGAARADDDGVVSAVHRSSSRR